MAPRSRPRTVGAALGLVLTLMGVAALGARTVPGTDRRAPVRLQVDAGRLVSIGFWVLAVASAAILVWAVWSSGIRILPRVRPQRSWVRALWTLAITAALVWLLVHFRPGVVVTPGPTLAPPPDEVAGPAAGPAVWVLAALLGIAATGILLAVRRPPRGAPPVDAAIEADAGRAGAEAPATGCSTVGGHRGAVIDAYAAMEGLFAGRGMARGRAETPREYVTRTIRRLGAASPAVRLTGLYEVARFSDGPVGQRMEAAAVEALAGVRHHLEEP